MPTEWTASVVNGFEISHPNNYWKPRSTIVE